MITGVVCPKCEAWTYVLSTRGAVRRRSCANLHAFYTEEVLLVKQNVTRVKRPTPAEWDAARMVVLVKKHSGNKSAAAREMGIPITTFISRWHSIHKP